MHREFSTLLRIHSQQWAAGKGIALEQIDPVVDTCPYPEEGDLASAVVFELARRAPKFLPDQIARSLVELHQESRYRELFSIVIAGGGYLNARPTQVFVQRFFELLRLEYGGVAQLFSVQSFVLERLPVSAEPAPFAVDWPELLSQAERHADSDIRRFVSLRGATGAKEDLIMLLALLGDKELEAEPYLQGLAGRQNVPWYLKRFFADSERALLSWGGEKRAAWSGATGEVFSFCVELMSLRHQLLKAGRRADDGGVVALMAATRVVRQFYSYFNNPRFRLVPSDHPVASQLSELTVHAREIVKTTLRLLPLNAALIA